MYTARLMRCLLGLVFLFIATTAYAESKPVIDVQFKITEPNYAASFDPEKIAIIQKRSAENIRKSLEEYFGFAEFKSQPDLPNHILVDLGGNANQASSISDVNFAISASGPRFEAEVATVKWIFRPVERCFEPCGTMDGFIDEIDVAFKERLAEKADELIAEMMSKLVLTNLACPIQEKVSWLIPFSKKSLQVDEDSQFVVRAELVVDFRHSSPRQNAVLTGEAESTHPDVQHSLSSYPEFSNRFPDKMIVVRILDDGAGHLDDMKNASEIAAQKVYLKSYIPLPRADLPLMGPMDVAAEGGTP